MNTRRAGTTRVVRRTGFTLPELVVAVGAAAILTASAGLLFRSVGDLASTGLADAQLDAAARVIERQLRDDFAAMSLIPTEQNFFAIRFRELGDINRNNIVDAPDERAVYLTDEAREEDLNLEVDPYEVDANGEPLSEAITTRLDEMIFLGRGQYESAQAVGGGRPVEAQHARIYWGHGLRPRPDPDFDPGDSNYVDPATGVVRPEVRQYIPDGDFAMRAGDSFDFAPTTAAAETFVVTGRNEYATSWPLTRTAALLYGGNAASLANVLDPLAQPLGPRRTFAPYIRDQEFFERFGSWFSAYSTQAGLGSLPDLGEPPIEESDLYTEPRWLYGGRTDVINQGLDDVRRWLEGELPPQVGAPPNTPVNYAGAYSVGPFVERAATLSFLGDDGSPITIMSRPLWLRERDSANADFGNLRGVQAAIAGVFSRPLVEDAAPTVISRVYDPALNGGDFREAPAFALMDAHAIMASRVSRFEIAWTDGTTVVGSNISDPNSPPGIDINGDAKTDLFVGDPVWFDISPVLDQNGVIIRRNTMAEWIDWSASNPDLIRFADPRLNGVTNVDNEVRNIASSLFPEILNDDLIALNTSVDASPSPFVSSPLPPFYNPTITGASRKGDGRLAPEAYAIWGFREPLINGQYGRPWPKPTLVRVRMTLHDRELRKSEGKAYEFIFPISTVN